MSQKSTTENIDLAEIFKSNDYLALKEASLKILKKKPDHVDALNALAISYKELGEIKNAEETFTLLVNGGAKVDYIYSNAGNFFYNIGKIDQALQLQKHAIKINPNNINALNQIGMALSNKGKDQDAIKYYEDAMKIDPSQDSTIINLANSNRNLERYDEAAKYYGYSEKKIAKCQQLECFYMLGDHLKFYENLDFFSKNYSPHPLAATLSKHASIRFDREDNYSFCPKPFEFVYKSDLFQKNNFDEKLVEDFFEVVNNLSLSVKEQSLLKNGKQSSGNLFLINEEPIQRIKKIIIDELELYKKKYKKHNAGIIESWPKNYRLYGWLIIMEKDGNLGAHMHKEGWVSGSIYLERPKRVDKFDGDLLFSLHGSNYPTDNKEYDSKLLQIEKGTMVLFPSSLFHGTFPFTSNEKRITLAFDVMPVD